MSELAKLKEEVKKNLRALLISAPTGLTLQQIQNDYHTMLGQPIPYRELGYNTVTDFIKSVPDCLQTHYERGLLLLYGVADDTTKHIAKLVSRQKVGLRCRRGRARSSNLPDLIYVHHLNGGGFKLYKKNPDSDDRRTINQIKTSKVEVQPAFLSAADQKDHPECVVDKNSPSKLTDLTQTTDDDEGGNESLNSSFISDSRVDDSIDDELKEQVRKILCKRPAGLWAAQLQPEYKQLTGKDLPLKPLGFYSVIELVSLIPDVVTIERPTNKGDWLLYDTRLYKKEKSKETATEKKTNVKTVDSCVKYNIWYVLSCHPNGIFLSNLQAVYMKHSEEIIYPQHLGFKDLLSLLKSIPDAVIVEERLTGHIVLHANKFFQPGPISEQLAAPKISPRRYVHKSVPPDAVGSGVGYSTVVIPAVDYLEVYLASVISPGNFCIQIKSDETSVALDIVMDALEKIYCSSESEHYQMPDCMLAVGQVCCAIYQQDSNWHRALITGVRDSEFIEVLYVDYGNIAIVPKSCLRLLKSCFLHLPAQAVQSRLANVKPTKSGWTRATRDRILELCKDKPLVALITGIKNEIISMCLCDTSGETDVHINDLLVAEGLAIFCPEKPLENTEDESQEPLKAPTEPVEDSTSVNLNDSQTDAMPAWTTVYNEENEYSLTKEDIELMEQMNQEIEGTTSIVSNEDIHEEVKGPQFVKKVDLTGKYKAHIIKYEDEPYLLSGQISSYLWEIDMLRAMMRQKTLRVKQVILAEKDHHELFDCIKRNCVPGCMDGDVAKPFLTLYHLSCIPDILKLFKCPAEKLIDALEYEALQFDPEDDYWKGEVVTHEDVKLGADEDVLIDLEYGLDDLKLLLQVMQFKRKRILKAMISDSDKHLVNELQFVEQQITDVRNAIQYRGYEDVKKEKETNSNDEICSPIVEELSKNEDEVQEEISQSSINNEGQISEKSDCQQATSSNNTMNKDDDKINEEDISEADLSRKVISNPQARVEPIMKDSVDNDQPSDAIEIEPSKSAPSNPSVSSLQSDMITYNQQNANQYQRCSSSQQQNSGQYPYCPTSQQNAGQYPLCPPEQENASQYPYCTTPQQNAGQYPLCPPQQHNTGQYQQNVGQYQCWPAQQHNAGQYHQNAGQYHQNAGQYHQNAGQYHQNASQYQQNAGQYHQNVGQYQQRSGYHNQRRSYGMQNQFAQNQYCNYPPRNFGPVSQNQQQMAAYNHMQQTQFGQFQNTNNFGQGRGKAQTLGYGYM
ncbi:uncharacterized protein LOC102806254 [Saccoglossus kowalevskii]